MINSSYASYWIRTFYQVFFPHNKINKQSVLKKLILTILALCCLFSNVLAQDITLTGTIQDDNHEAVPFANVALFVANDTTQIIQGGSSGLEGQFAMEHLAHQKYLLRISFIGYKTSETIIDLQTTSEHAVEKNIILHTDAVALKEVVIAGKRATQSIDKTAYTFNQEQVAKAQQSRELIATLPNLHINEVANTLSAVNGKTIMILINGVESTDSDLQLIPADKIIKVDYYDVPPMRYMNNAGIVINVHTKPLDTGLAGSIYGSYGQMFSGAVTNLSYVKGNSKWTATYINHFNMKRSVQNEETGDYTYQINENQYNYNYDKRMKYWGDQHAGRITYAHSVEDKHQLKVTGGASWMNDKSEESSLITNTKNQFTETNTGSLNNRVESQSASLDIYYSRVLKNKQQLTVDVLGTYHGNNQHARSLQTGSNGFEDNLAIDNSKRSLIGELIYEKDFGKAYLTTGYRGYFNFLSNDVTNSLTDASATEDIQTQRHFLYSELSGKWHDWMYRASIAGTYDTKLGDAGFNHTTFTPLFMIGYNINASQRVRLSYKARTRMPGVQEMSNTRILIMNDFYQTGNPSLHNEKTQLWTLGHSYNGSWLTLYTSLYYKHQHNALYNAYMQGDDAVLLQTANAKKNEELGGTVDIDINPCKYIRLSGSLGATQYRFKASDDVSTYKDWSYPVKIYVSAKYNKYSLGFSQRFGGYDMVGIYKRTIEKASSLSLTYKHKQFRVSALCYFPFVDDEVSFETIPETKVVHKKDLHMRRKDHAFGVTFSWFFNRGKRKYVEQKTDNRDDDKGVFRF